LDGKEFALSKNEQVEQTIANDEKSVVGANQQVENMKTNGSGGQQQQEHNQSMQN
jgi:hypothetical protein